MRSFTSLFLLLLLYILSALIFWGVSLQKQSAQIFSQDLQLLRAQVDSSEAPEVYNVRLNELKHIRSMHTGQYIGEGTIFLLVILIGAVVVYTAFVRRIKLSRQQNNFMLSVTHELKSPIAAMKLSLQTLQKHELDEQKRKTLLDRCIKESDRLNDLCNNMLFTSQIEGGQYRFAKERFNLSELAEEAVNDYALRHPREFEVAIDPVVNVAGDKVMLRMAVNNLLENAIKYTPGHKAITVELTRNNGNAILQVKDEGQGIPDSEKKNIFTKFYRIGNEESRSHKGTGLGLYLTNKIILQHEGRITVKDNTPSGSIFEISLPAD